MSVIGFSSLTPSFQAQVPLHGGFVRGTFKCAGLGKIAGLLTRIKAATSCSFSSKHSVALSEVFPMNKATPEIPNTLEQSLLHIDELLSCAAATAYETGDNLNGPKRDLAFSVVHLIGMAKTELARSLVRVESR